MKFANKVFQCVVIIFLTFVTATVAFAQTPTSGALLTITDSSNNLVSGIWDSQIHTGTLIATCDLAPFNKTDAFVFQGSSWTGCDNGDQIETNNFTSRTGTKTIVVNGQSFTFQTQYIYNTTDQNCAVGAEVCGTPICNTNGNICIYPASQGGGTAPKSIDTGFVTVTNNGPSAFTGTITLSGTPNSPGGMWCPGPGLATDTIVFAGEGALSVGGQATFALAIDSSNCGGWGADEILPIAENQTTTFLFGKDSLAITPTLPILVNQGDEILFRPIAVPQTNFNFPLPGATLTSSPFGNGSSCISDAGFSAEGNGAANQLGVCAEIQTSCLNSGVACLTAESFTWSGQFLFTIDQDSLPDGVGGVHFLGQKAANCPQNSFGEDAIISFTGSSPGLDPPLHPGGSGLNCFAATYTPGAAPVPAGVVVSAIDFEFPGGTPDNGGNDPPPPAPLKVCPGCSFVFSWDQSNGAGGPPLANLHYCRTLNPVNPSACSMPANVATPWDAFQWVPFTCPDGKQPNFATTSVQPLLGLLNFGKGEYAFSAFIPFNYRGCATLQFTTNTGTVASFVSIEITPGGSPLL